MTGKGASPFPKNQARLTFLVSVFGLWAYLSMIWYDWTGRLEGEQAAPGADLSAEAN